MNNLNFPKNSLINFLKTITFSKTDIFKKNSDFKNIFRQNDSQVGLNFVGKKNLFTKYINFENAFFTRHKGRWVCSLQPPFKAQKFRWPGVKNI